MTDAIDVERFRADLIDGIRASRALEIEVFGALDPAVRDAPGPDGGWSPKDIQAHLSAWKQREAARLAARREGRDAPDAADGELDAINAGYHAERADWTWEAVESDATAATEALIDEVERADGALLLRTADAAPILTDGAEHTADHLSQLADRSAGPASVDDLMTTIAATIDAGDWPVEVGARTRYNLACVRVRAGQLDEARALLRRALPASPPLMEWAPKDDDLIALRDELPELAGSSAQG